MPDSKSGALNHLATPHRKTAFYHTSVTVARRRRPSLSGPATDQFLLVKSSGKPLLAGKTLDRSPFTAVLFVIQPYQNTNLHFADE
ncbi:MAG: hypothetical protein KJ046_14265, partial [Anaerolineae bacterium]|nr:hypothetical protein [Anaerolineae bacterium]